MVYSVQQFAAIVPAGTPIAAPVTLQCQLGDSAVEWIEVEVPLGCNGVVGFYVASSRQQMFPARSGATPLWVVTNGRVVRWDVHDQPDSGDWQLVAYNTGINPHTLTARFGYSLVPAPVAVTPALIPSALLSA